MKRVTVAAAILSIVVGVGSAQAREKGGERVSLIPGAKAESCIQVRQIRETRVRDDNTIDFYMNGRRIYRNVLPQRCPSLGSEETFTYATSLSRLCSTDIITVLFHAGGGFQRGPSCGLGEFQPAVEAKRSAR